MDSLRRWRVSLALAGVAVAALVLAPLLGWPPEAYAVTPMALYAMMWTVLRQLDAPPPPPRPPRRRGPPRPAAPAPRGPAAPPPRAKAPARRPVPALAEA